ncbi:hypothetical protein cypCar_00021425 [Cyprinus carpio]|nr:hypothetical protein cypCar_00021425 [Cyprinus carpio]
MVGKKAYLSSSLPFVIMNIASQPFKRGIYCQDESISYPVKQDTITIATLAVVTITCTVIITSSGEAYLVYSKKIHSNSIFNQYVSAIYKVLGAFLFGGAVSQSLTDLAKYTIGRPRPHFLTVCAPKFCKGYMASINCTGDPRDVTEARLSFYSGHASFGMYCMLFLAFYVQARLNGKWARLLRPTIQFFLVAFAVHCLLQVRYISNFFKVRTFPQCPSPETAENEERKPSLHLSEVEHNNHLGYSGPA